MTAPRSTLKSGGPFYVE